MLLYPLVLVAIWFVTGLSFLLVFASGSVIGQIWLSPDLDIKSTPWRRWWIFKWLWVPYQRIMPHRSWASHWPVFGTTFRLLYLALLLAPFVGIALACGVEIDWRLAIKYAEELQILVAGIECAAILHFAADKLI